MMYIVFEWVVGTWKTTQSKRLAEYFQTLFPKRNVEYVREPGGTEIAEAIRTLVQGTDFEEEMHPTTDAYLYAAARAQIIHQRIQPALDRGDIVVSDRSFVSSLAYQWHTQGMGIDFVWDLNKHAVGDCLPDVILFMELDVEIGLWRTFDSDGDKWEKNDADFFRRIEQWYHLSAEKSMVRDRWSMVDASGTQDEVFDNILETIKQGDKTKTLFSRD